MRRPSGKGGLIASIAISVLLIVGINMIGAFAKPDVAVRTLEAQGFGNVQIVEHAWFVVGLRGCGHDSARFTVKATNPAGKAVQLYVCTGIFKGGTIRVP